MLYTTLPRDPPRRTEKTWARWTDEGKTGTANTISNGDGPGLTPASFNTLTMKLSTPARFELQRKLGYIV